MLHTSDLVDAYPLLGLILLLILGFLGLPFPEDMTLVLCGFLIANDALSPVRAVIVIYCVLVCLDLVFFFAGRKYGPGIVNHRTFRRVLSPGRLRQLERKFDKWGVLLIVLGRHIVVLRTQLLIAAGIFKLSPVKFLAADLITVPVTMAIMIGLGYAGGSSLQAVQKDITRIEHIAALLVIAIIIVYLLYRFIKYRRI